MTDTEQERIKEICKVAHIDDISDLSDGYHTFRQLYYQRMMLFAVIVKQNRDKAWKSLRHEDGELCFGGGWFIVGIDTPKGSYTYHYEDNYFSLFDCVELERGKKWDGHTEKDVTRLLSLEQESCDDAINRQAVLEYIEGSEAELAHDLEKELVCQDIKELPSIAPKLCEDCISRQAVDEIIELMTDINGDTVYAVRMSNIRQLPSVKPQEPKTEQFAEWVAREIFDEMWEYNKDAFAELACRKLSKLGIVKAKGDKWELVNLPESEDSTIEADNKYEAKVITRGNCMMCGKKLTEGLFFCKECEGKGK